MIKLKDKHFWIWLAGFIDGDGCIYIAKSKNKRTRVGYQYCLRLEIAQTDRELLDDIKDRIGYGSNTWNKTRDKYYRGINGKNHHSRRSYAMKLSARQACEVLKKIYPYLVVKKEQARLAIEFQEEMKKRSTRRATDKYYENQAFYCNKLKELKIAP